MAQPRSIDIVRRPNAGESANITAERYFAQASLKILLSDDPQDIMNLPCIDTSTQPFDLSKLAQPVNLWPVAAPYGTLKANMTAAGANYVPLPLAASGAKVGTANPGSGYIPADGYWLPNPGPGLAYPIVKGFLKIEAQTLYGNPCGNWRDVTVEILGLGYVGKNINPLAGLVAANYGPPTAAAGAPLTPFPCSATPSQPLPNWVSKTLVVLARIPIPMRSFGWNAFETTLPLGRMRTVAVPGALHLRPLTFGPTLFSMPAKALFATSPLPLLSAPTPH